MRSFLFSPLLSVPLAASAIAACSPPLTAAEQTDLEHHAAILSTCRDEGRAARDAAAYDGCKYDAGIGREAGSK